MSDQQTRIFKIGTSTIVEEDSMRELDKEAIRELLKPSFPEVAHATIRERTLEDGTMVLDFIARPGRKG